jgi:N-acetyl-gamma-glutamyl-phosphate reductase
MMHKNATAAKAKTSVSIVGARGYAGVELTKLLLKHPHAELKYAFATKDFSITNDVLAQGAQKIVCLTDDKIMDNLTDVVFLATPAEVSLELAPQIAKAGKKVIDLSGAFRLKKNDYNKWYKFDHTEKEMLMSADYGLVPFAGPINKTNLIANPGCYATAISMALIPLVKKNLIDTTHLVIDAKSGTTGAGKKASENILFSEVDGNCGPYRVGKHQHTPEIQEAVETWGKTEIDPHFSTTLLPVKTGIIAAIYAQALTTDIKKIEEAYADTYAGYDLVRHGNNIEVLSSLSKVVGTPYTHISYELVGNKLYVFSVIDNLLKGAASQAVENLNRFLDLPPSFSLI